LTLALPWAGATASGLAYAISLEQSYAASAIESNRRLAEIVARINAGTFLDFDATGTLAERAAFNAAAKDFVYCQTDVTPFLVFIKRSATSGDWSTGTALQGPAGSATNGTNGTNGTFTGLEANSLVKATDKIPMRVGGVNYMADARYVAPRPLLNGLYDGGRFAGLEAMGFATADRAFVAGNFGTFNGAVQSAGPSYSYNSTTFGGTAAAAAVTIQDLLTAAGFNAAAKRYQLPFNTMRVTAGAGTVAQQGGSPGRYLSSLGLEGVLTRKQTLGFWVRCETGSIGFQRGPYNEANSDYMVNGVLQGGAVTVLLPADGWRHITYIKDTEVGAATDNANDGYQFGAMYASPAATYLIALPWLFYGLFFPTPTELPFIINSNQVRRLS
jgi:hypothetical protein